MPRPFLKTDIVMLAEHAGDFALKENLAGLRDVEAVQEKTRALLKRYFRKRLDRRPMILPVIWEM